MVQKRGNQNTDNVARMMKLILFLFCVLFVFVIKTQEQLIHSDTLSISKSFSAHCQTTETCEYSLVLSTSSGSYSANVTVDVDSSVGNPQIVNVKASEPATIKITVTEISQITITINSVTSPSNSMLITLYDSVGNVVTDSKQLVFRVPNYCQSSLCVLAFQRSSEWTKGLVAQFKVNNTVAATLDEKSLTVITVPVAQYDLLIIEIIPDPNEDPIPDDITVSVFDGTSYPFNWYSNFYYTPMITYSNGCGNPPPPPEPIHSPFGGYLYQIKQKQLEEFLRRIGTSYSALWYRITKNEI